MMCQDKHFDIFETTAIFKICKYPSVESSIISENIDQSSWIISIESCQKGSCKDRLEKSFLPAY